MLSGKWKYAKHGVEDVAAHVVEEHVDAVGGELAESAGDVLVAVVHRCVEPEVVHQVRALRWAAGDADHPGAVALRDLAGDRSDRAGSSRDHEDVTGLGFRDVPDPDPGGDTGRRAEDPDVGAERLDRSVDLLDRRRRDIGDRLGTQPTTNGLPGLKPGRGGLDHAPDAAGEDRLADRHLPVEALAAQHGPSAGVDRDVLDGHAHLVGAQFAQCFGLDAEAVRRRLAVGALGEHDTGVGGSHALFLVLSSAFSSVLELRLERGRCWQAATVAAHE